MVTFNSKFMRATDSMAEMSCTLGSVCARIDFDYGLLWQNVDGVMTIAASEGLGLGQSKIRMLQSSRQETQRRSIDRGQTKPEEAYSFPVGVGMPGRVVQTGKHEWISNVQLEEESNFLRQKVAVDAGIKTVFCVSLGNGNVVEYGSKKDLSENLELIDIAKETSKHNMTGHPLMQC